MNKYFSLLKCGDAKDLSGRAAFCEREFTTIGDDCKARFDPAFCYRHSINTVAWMLYLHHFGFRSTLAPQRITLKGSDLSVAYFGMVGEELAKPETRTAWFAPYCEALLLATLGGHARERTEFSNCLHANLLVETAAIRIEPALGDVLLCVAKSFQSSPIDTAGLEERLRGSRKKRPKLLFAAWQAPEGHDKAKFGKALADATANFAKTTAEDDLPLTAVAVPEAILAGLAYERGWTDLSFELPIAARLVTHQSLGLT